MKLDPRIIEGKRPFGHFYAEEAKQFIGKKCYFADNVFFLWHGAWQPFGMVKGNNHD